MAEYFPLLMIAALLAGASIVIAWPWLRQKPTRDRAMMLCAVTMFLSLALYMAVGSPFALPQIAAHQQSNTQMQRNITNLKSDLSSADTTDKAVMAESWVKLGGGYMQLEQYDKAQEAYRQAVLASEGEPHVILAYGKAQMLAADGEVTQGAQTAFRMAADMLPNDSEPLFLLAVGKMQAGDREGANQLFAELLPRLPEGAPLRARILRRLSSGGDEATPK